MGLKLVLQHQTYSKIEWPQYSLQNITIPTFGKFNNYANHVSTGCLCYQHIWKAMALSRRIDEAHEMLINKECKQSIVRSLPDYINRIHTEQGITELSKMSYFLQQNNVSIQLTTLLQTEG